MSLLERQSAFRDEIAAADDAEPASSVGMEIYRNAYRGRLLGALEVSFERVRRWVGEQAFTAAACHYILTHPPRGWTLDSFGAEFPKVLTELFADDAEVAELAWLEWHIQQAFAARDGAPLDPAHLAAVGYNATDWDRMRFDFTPGFALRSLTTNCIPLWHHLEPNQIESMFEVELNPGHAAVVWRKACLPRVRELDHAEFRALEAMAGGGTFGSVATFCEPDQLGQWLAQWLCDGLISGARTA